MSQVYTLREPVGVGVNACRAKRAEKDAMREKLHLIDERLSHLEASLDRLITTLEAGDGCCSRD